jgi:hypothetical protein
VLRSVVVAVIFLSYKIGLPFFSNDVGELRIISLSKGKKHVGAEANTTQTVSVLQTQVRHTQEEKTT